MFTYHLFNALLGGKLIFTFKAAFDPLLTLCELSHFIL